MSRAVICIVKTQLQAETVVSRLKGAGFPTSEISLLLPERDGLLGLARDRDSALAGPAATGRRLPAAISAGSTGSVIGGVFGLLAGIGILAIPGAGPFIAAGPIIAALGGTAMGAAVGGIAGALIWMGIPERTARHYETRVRAGQILVSVQTHHLTEIRRAERVLAEVGAEDVSVVEDAVPIPFPEFRQPGSHA